MADPAIGLFDLAQRRARVALLIPPLLSGSRALAADPWRILQIVAGWRLPLFSPRQRSSSMIRPGRRVLQRCFYWNQYSDIGRHRFVRNAASFTTISH